MAIPVLIYGKSGSGKSRSMKNFAEDEIVLFNVERKSLPFKKKFQYVSTTDDWEKIISKLKAMPTKSAVIDDAGFLMTHKFMEKHTIMKGSSQFDLYNEIADSMYNLIEKIKKEVPDDRIVYIIMHEDQNDFGNVTLRTIGKLIDNKINGLESMVTICLRCIGDGKKHFFRTVTDGSDITKAPEDLFQEEEIDNDLKAVDTAIREYYELNKTEDKKQ